MPIFEQAGYPESTLRKFLDARLPQRDIVAQAWTKLAGTAPWSAIEIPFDYRAQLGRAAEIRIGLDLATTPGYWHVLSFLPADECRDLLCSAGYSSDELEHLADTDTNDPLLRDWSRIWHPVIYEEVQRQELAACWDAAGMSSIAHRLEYSAQLRRSWFYHAYQDLLDERRPQAPIDGLVHLWQGYLRFGRRQLLAHGDRVILEPELGHGFGRADLVVGRCLVDIKTSVNPAAKFDVWLNQVLGYALLDWSDILGVETIALYLSWHALLISESLTNVLSVSTNGPTPSLASLRADFRTEIQADVDEYVDAQMRDRYPPLLRPPSR